MGLLPPRRFPLLSPRFRPPLLSRPPQMLLLPPRHLPLLPRRRCYSSQHWKKSLERGINNLKDWMPIVSCTLRAALKEVLAGMKRFVLVVVDLLWELGRMATNRAFEGLKAKVNEGYYYIFIVIVAWIFYWVGQKLGIFNVISSDADPDFDKMMEDFSKDSNGAKVALGIIALKLLYQISKKATKIWLEIEEIRKEDGETRKEVEAIKATVCALQDELSQLKQEESPEVQQSQKESPGEQQSQKESAQEPQSREESPKE